MMAADLRVVAEGLGFPESPRWHDGRLWVSDMATREVVAISDEGESEIILQLDSKPSGLGWLPNGDLLIVAMESRLLWRVQDKTASVYADLTGLGTANLNDMV